MIYRLRTLGGVDLHAPDGREVRSILAQPKRLALLVYHALASAHRYRRRDTVVGLFWPELDQEHARGALRQALRFLRRELDDRLIVTRGEEEIGVDPALLRCDATAFSEACDAGQAAEAMALYRGDFLEGFFLSEEAPELDQWLDNERNRLRRLASSALWRIAEERRTAGDRAAGAAAARRAAEFFEDEGELRRPLLSLDDMVDRAGTGAVHKEFAQRLRRDYDVEPAPETQAVLLAVRDRTHLHEMEQVDRHREGPALRAEALEPEAREPGLVAGLAVRETAPRRVSRRAVVAALSVFAMLVLLVGYALRLGRVPGFEPGRVIVVPMVDATGDPSLAALGDMTADWVTRSLRETGSVDVVAASTVLFASRSGPAGSEAAAANLALARSTGAETLIGGRYGVLGDTVHLQLEFVNVESGTVEGSISASAAKSDPLQAVEAARGKVVGWLASKQDPRLAGWATRASNPPSFDAYREFVTGLQLLMRQSHAMGALEHFRLAAASDSGYSAPLVWAALAHAQVGQVREADSVLAELAARHLTLPPLERLLIERHRARALHDLQGALRLSREIVALAPRSQFLLMLAVDAGAVNRSQEGVTALQQLDWNQPWVREWQTYWAVLAYQLHQLGRYREELAVAREARRDRPELLRFVWLEIQALAGLGDTAAIRERLGEAETFAWSESANPGQSWTPYHLMRNASRELRAHGFRAASREVQSRTFAWLAGRPEPERHSVETDPEFLGFLMEAERYADAERLARELFPLDSSVRGILGSVAAYRGKRLEALAILDTLDQLPSGADGGEAKISAAGIASVLGERERALRLLREAFARGFGFSYYDHLQEQFEPLWSYAPYREFMRPKG